MGVENMVKNFEAEPNDKGKEFQKIKVDEITDMSFDEAFKNTKKYLVFEVSSTKNLQEVMQDKDTEYLYFKQGDIVIKAKKEDISVENGKIYVYDFTTLVLYPILGRIPPLLSEAKVGDECQLFFTETIDNQ